jgi:hypothetical protein
LRRFAVALLVLFACSREQDPIAQLVANIEAAAEDRDAAGVMQHLSASYAGRANVETTLRRYFFGYRALEVHVRDLQTQLSGSQGWCTFGVDFTGVPKNVGGMDQFLPRAATYRFELVLADEEGEWKVTSAKWEEERR